MTVFVSFDKLSYQQWYMHLVNVRIHMIHTCICVVVLSNYMIVHSVHSSISLVTINEEQTSTQPNDLLYIVGLRYFSCLL